MIPARFLFLIFLLTGVVLSGCLREYGRVEITSVDIMSSQKEDKIELAITPYIKNNLDTDTGLLSVRVKVKDPGTNLIVAEKSSDIGYIKSKSANYNTISLEISNPGEYGVEVEVFEGGEKLNQYATPVNVKATPGQGQPAEIKLTDMNLVITKFVNDASNAVVEVSPGIYNQGGDSRQLTMIVTARVDPYTAYNESDELGIVKSTDRVRGKVSFIIPRNREYSFTVSVVQDGKTVVSGSVSEKVKLNEIKFNTPMNFVFVEEGKPRPAATPTSGFEAAIALAGILMIYCIISRFRKVTK